MERRYRDHTKDAPHMRWHGWQGCEHCDAERSNFVRNDELRGNVCPPCDSSLDAMFGDGWGAEAAK